MAIVGGVAVVVRDVDGVVAGVVVVCSSLCVLCFCVQVYVIAIRVVYLLVLQLGRQGHAHRPIMNVGYRVRPGMNFVHRSCVRCVCFVLHRVSCVRRSSSCVVCSVFLVVCSSLFVSAVCFRSLVSAVCVR